MDSTYVKFKFDKVGVIGAGPAGLNIASVAARRADEVFVYSHPDHSSIFDVLKQHGGHITVKHGINGDGYVQEFDVNATQNLVEVLSQVSIVFITVPVQGREDLLLKQIIPLLASTMPDGRPIFPHGFSRHLFVFVPDSFSVVTSKELFERAGVPNHLQPRFIMGTSSAPASSRFLKGVSVVKGTKVNLAIGCLPPNPPEEVRSIIDSMFAPNLKWVDPIQVAMMQVNMIIHPAGLLSRLDQHIGDHSRKQHYTGIKDYFFYRDALAMDTALALVAGGDEEKRAIAKVLGRRPWTVLETVNFHYGTNYQTWQDFVVDSPILNLIRDGPKSGHHRHFDQDVPHGCCVLESLGKVFGIETPYCTAMVDGADRINSTAYRKKATTLYNLGLGRLSQEEARAKWTAWPYSVGQPKLHRRRVYFDHN